MGIPAAVVVIVIAVPTMRIGHAFEWKIDLLVIVIELNLKFNKLYKKAQPRPGQHSSQQQQAIRRLTQNAQIVNFLIS